MPFPKGASWWAGVGALAYYTQGEIDILRFFESVDVQDGCWMWTGRLWENAYGRFEYGGHKTTQRKAHKVLYEWCLGPVPKGKDLDHTCHNADPSCPGAWNCPHRACVKPRHLEIVTRGQNLQRGRDRAFLSALTLATA